MQSDVLTKLITSKKNSNTFEFITCISMLNKYLPSRRECHLINIHKNILSPEIKIVKTEKRQYELKHEYIL